MFQALLGDSIGLLSDLFVNVAALIESWYAYAFPLVIAYIVWSYQKIKK